MEKQISISNTLSGPDIEKDVGLILKRVNGKRQLIKVTLRGNNLIMEFSEKTSKSAKAFVKVFNKEDKELKKRGVVRKGYKSVDEIKSRAFNQEQMKDLDDKGFELARVIETNKFWILFWSKA